MRARKCIHVTARLIIYRKVMCTTSVYSSLALGREKIERKRNMEGSESERIMYNTKSNAI